MIGRTHFSLKLLYYLDFIEIYSMTLYPIKLDIFNRGLTTLDGIDLTGVTIIDCYNNQLTSLPPLPETLEKLDCSNNQLTSLPPLPETLQELICTNNQLTSLPPLPETLEILYCSGNFLKSLPPLPETLEILSYFNNYITLFPDLPWGLRNYWEKEKLEQHNKRLKDLQMETVETLPDKETWDQINEMWIHWQYRIGGEKYIEATLSF